LENIGRTNQEALQLENKDERWKDYLEKILSFLAIFSIISYTKHITRSEAQAAVASYFEAREWRLELGFLYIYSLYSKIQF
jgi:negative regulator of genetic competence, sporulation and motility